MRAEYESAWSLPLLPDWQKKVKLLAARELLNRPRYQVVASQLGIPWQVVAVIHGREDESLSFAHHLHNGDDPLDAPTVEEPSGRPRGWLRLPPSERTWERSAVDALTEAAVVADWDDIAEALYFLEGYNGFGPRNHGRRSGYVYAGTSNYQGGKFVADGPAGWDPHAMDQQPGVLPMLRELGFPEHRVVGSPQPKLAVVGAPAAPAEAPGRTDMFDDLYKEFQQAVDSQLVLAKDAARQYVKGGWLKLKAIAHDSAARAETSGKDLAGPDKLKLALELGETELEQHIDWGKAPFLLRSALREGLHFALETLIERTVTLAQYILGADWGKSLDEQVQKIEWSLEEKLGTDLGGDGVVGKPPLVSVTVNQK